MDKCRFEEPKCFSENREISGVLKGFGGLFGSASRLSAQRFCVMAGLSLRSYDPFRAKKAFKASAYFETVERKVSLPSFNSHS